MLNVFDAHALRSACQELGRTFTIVWERVQERVHKSLLQPFLIIRHLVNPNKHIYGLLLDYYFVLRSTSVQNLIDGKKLDRYHWNNDAKLSIAFWCARAPERAPRARTYFYSCLGARAGARAQMPTSTISNHSSSCKSKQTYTDYYFVVRSTNGLKPDWLTTNRYHWNSAAKC